MLAKDILVHGVIGYKFCWLLPSEDHNQGTPTGHESNGTTVTDHWEDMNQLRHQLGTNQNCATSVLKRLYHYEVAPSLAMTPFDSSPIGVPLIQSLDMSYQQNL